MSTQAIQQVAEKGSARPRLVLEDVRQVGGRIGKSASWIWGAVKRGEFPSPARLSSKCTRWNSAHVDAWIEAQFSGKGTK